MDTDYATKWGQNNQHVNGGCPLFVPDTKAYAIQERAICENPNAGPDGVGVRSDNVAYTLEARTVPQAVAFQQNTRDEVRYINGDGQIAGALAAQSGMKQTNYVATFNDDGTARTLTARHDSSPCHDRGPDVVAVNISNGEPRLADVIGTLDCWSVKGRGSSQQTAVMQSVAFAIQERAVCKNPDAGPDVVAFSSNMSVPDCQTDGSTPTLKIGGHGGGNPPAVAYALRGREGGSQLEGPHDTANIRAASGGSSKSYVMQPAMAFQSSQSGVRAAETHATLDANNGSRRHNGALVGSAVRRLTPVECERLQGFPDGFTAIPWRKKAADDCPDGPRYKALGNSMAVPVMRWIGQRIQMVEDLTSLL